MVRLAVFPIIAVAVLAILGIIALVIALSVKSRNGKLLALLPIGAVFCLLLLVGGLTAVRTTAVHQEAVAMEREVLDAEAAAVRAALEEHQFASPSRVLDFRGDSVPVVTDPVTSPTPTEIVSYSPSGSSEERTLPTLPEWVSEQTQFDPQLSSQELVLSSYPKLSVEEADDELYKLLVAHSADFLAAEYPQAEGWYPDRESLMRMPLIQEAVTERFPLEVSGDHTVEMQRAHWRVELTDDIRQQLFELWRPTLVHDRLMQLGGTLGILTLLFAVSAGIFRFRQRPRRRAGVREASAAVAVLTLLLAGISTLFLA